MGDVRAKLAELLPEEVEHFLKEVPRLLAEGCQFKQLFRCLTDFDFLEAKVNHPGFGVQALIEDYDLVDDSEVLAHPEYNPEKVKALKLIQGAIGLSAPVLVKDKTQLAGQLLGRLLSFEVPEIQAMLNQAKQRKDSLWLCALTPSLTRPGGRLLRTFTGHTKSVNAVAVIPKTDLVISGSSDSTLKVWSLETGKELLTLTGHTDSINAVAITPDGKRVISGSSDSTLKVWNLETGEELLTYHSKPITAVAVTPDGKRVISGSFWVERFYYTSTPGLGMPFDSSVKTWHGTLNIWDLDTGENFLTLHPPSGNGINAVAVTLDGKQVISDLSDSSLNVWNLEHKEKQREPRAVKKLCQSLSNVIYPVLGRPNFTLPGHNTWVNAIAVTPNGKQVISGSSDKTLKIWDLETRKELFSLTDHTDSINAIAVTPNGKWVISGSCDKTLKLWNLESEEEDFTFTTDNDSVAAVLLTNNSNHLISDSSGHNLKILNGGTDQQPFLPTGHSGSVQAVAITSNGKQVISGSSDKTLKVWNLETGQQQFTFPDGSASVNAIAITSGDQQVISGLSDGVLIAWNLETREKVLYLSSIPDEEILSFTRYRGGDIYIRLYKLFLYIGLALLLLLIARASLLLLNYFKDILSLFNSIIGRFLNLVALFFCVSLIGAMPTISALNNGKDNYNQTAIAVTANGKQVISGSSVGTLKVWDLENRKKRFILTGHTSSVNAVAVIPNTYLVISGSSDKTLKVWDLKTGKNLFPLIGHSDAVNAIAVIPNTYLVISGSSDKTLKVWNAITGRTRFTLTGHRDAVTAVAVTSNGRQAISTSLDNTLKVWDLSRGKLIASFTGDSALLCCAVAPDGVTIVAGEASGRVHFLRLEGIEA